MNRLFQIGRVSACLFAVSVSLMLFAADEVPKQAETKAEAPADVTVQSVVDGFKIAMDKKSLKVESIQDVSFVLVRNSADQSKMPTFPTIKTVTVKISAEMEEKALHTAIVRCDGVGQTGSKKPDLILALKDGVFTEKHWYEINQDYRTVSYPSPETFGAVDLEVDSSIFESIPSQVCATAEFFCSWLGKDSFTKTFSNILGYSTHIIREKYFDKHKILYPKGRDAYHLVRPVYDDTSPSGRQIRNDHFWVDVESLMVIGWNTELTDVENESASHFQLVERSYSYPQGGLVLVKSEK